LSSVSAATDTTIQPELLNSFPHGVLVCDPEGRIVHANTELLRQFGYAMDELVGQSVDILLPEKHRTAHSQYLRAYMAAPTKRAMGIGRELQGQRRDGTIFPIEIGLNPLETSGGSRILATVTDITARLRTESNFRKMVEGAPVGMLIVDSTGRINQANARLLAIFGYSPDELIGQTLEVLLPERHRLQHVHHTRGFHEQPSTRVMGHGRDLTGLHKSGMEIPVEIGLNPIETEDGPIVIATVSDISDRKKAELKLKQLNADLDEFTYVASHDLRSPLRGISNLVEWIEEDLGEGASEDTRNNLERINLRVGRMEKLVDDLLAYARSGRQGNDITTVDLRRMVDEVVQFVDPPQQYQVEVTGEFPSIRTAITPLETVLRNLLSNAVKHHDLDRGKIQIKVVMDDAFCIFEVADDGPGIPPTAHERVFKLFQALSDKNGTRSGVGLAVSKRLVEVHGGKIELQSEGGQRGTRFRFWWPRYARRDINE